MQTILKEPVNVVALYRGYREEANHETEGWEHKRITPKQIHRENRNVLEVEEVRRSYGQRKGKRLQVHFVVRCTGGRYFHLVYDAERIIWILMYQFDDEMLFDEREVDIEINYTGVPETEMAKANKDTTK